MHCREMMGFREQNTPKGSFTEVCEDIDVFKN